MDRTVLTEADDHIRYMEWFLEEVRGTLPEEEKVTPEHIKISEVLEWHLKIAKVHYRNLLHCYKIAEDSNKD